MNVSILSRVFVIDGQELPDPNPNLTVEEVRDLYANTYPAITNSVAKQEDQKKDGVPFKKITFKPVNGDNG